MQSKAVVHCDGRAPLVIKHGLSLPWIHVGDLGLDVEQLSSRQGSAPNNLSSYRT